MSRRNIDEGSQSSKFRLKTYLHVYDLDLSLGVFFFYEQNLWNYFFILEVFWLEFKIVFACRGDWTRVWTRLLGEGGPEFSLYFFIDILKLKFVLFFYFF